MYTVFVGVLDVSLTGIALEFHKPRNLAADCPCLQGDRREGTDHRASLAWGVTASLYAPRVLKGCSGCSTHAVAGGGKVGY